MAFTLRSRSQKPQELLVDLAVHFVKASGAAAKVFKLEADRPPAARAAELRTTFSWRSTRRACRARAATPWTYC